MAKNLVLKIADKLFGGFFRSEATSSIFLLSMVGLALYMANSHLHDLYEKIVHYPFGFHFGTVSFKANLHFLVNEGLMSIFFFVVGMEIKRELVEGELSSAKKAALPIFAAIGGSIIPALIYFYINKGLPTEKGWGIPMATDIAFALSVLTLLSHKVPFALKIFLLSVAIIDDIIAVLVIALFYSKEVSGPHLALIFICALACFIYFKLKKENNLLLICLALAMWVAFYRSGIHPSLCGVLLGCLVPHKNFWSEKEATSFMNKIFGKKAGPKAGEIRKLKSMVGNTQSLLQRLINFYHPLVIILIMPLFAFANAGVVFKGLEFEKFISSPLSYGIIIGLCIGKPIGIFLFSWLPCQLKICEKPDVITWRQILAVGFICGIGFTMSLFIMNLCFSSASSFFSFAKLGILSASGISAFLGLVLLLFCKTVPPKLRKNPHA